MSRIGKKSIEIPSDVRIKLCDDKLNVNGPMGEGHVMIPEQLTISINEKQINIINNNNKKNTRSLWGLTRSLIYNMVSGVHKPFTKKLLLVGPGYKCKILDQYLVLSLGYSHDIIYHMHKKVRIQCEKDNVLSLYSHDKSLLGQITAEIRSLRAVEPYKGKGVRYHDEKVILKKGKDNKK